MTRDLVDGMGGTGVDGVFRRCCEKTMMVMRSSQEELKTIVEVSLYILTGYFKVIMKCFEVQNPGLAQVELHCILSFVTC